MTDSDLIGAAIERYHALSQTTRNRFVGWLIASDPVRAMAELDRYEAFHDPARVSEVVQ